MELGGIERSLLGLLDAIDYTRYDVDLFLYGHHGVLFDFINKNVHLLEEVNELAYLRESFAEKIKHRAYYSAFRRIIDGMRKYDCDESWRIVLEHTKIKFEKQYDIALGFFQPFDFLRECINADIKVGWIHTDYSAGLKNARELEFIYRKLDYIVAVSEECKKAFCKIVPNYSEEVIVIENILSPNFIYEQASLFNVKEEMKDDGTIKLLSVGRFCEAKNFDNIPSICKKIREKGCNVKWYLIGFGNDEKLIYNKIEEFGMQEYVLVLGKKENPYPYIKACDLYVQPSRYEGKAVTVREAQILNKPVVITNYTTAHSQVKNGYDGVIVPMDNEGCAEQIAAILKNEEIKNKLVKNCANENYGNQEEVNKIYRLMLE